MLFNRYLIAAAALALLSACSSTETVDPQAGAGTATTMPGDTAGSGVASVQADTEWRKIVHAIEHPKHTIPFAKLFITK